MGVRGNWSAVSPESRSGAKAGANDEHEAEIRALRKLVGALSAQNDRLLELYENAPVGFVTLDACVRVVEANASAERMLGRQRGQLQNTSLLSYTGPSDAAKLVRHVRDVLASFEKQSCEITLHERETGTDFLATLQSIAARGPLGDWRCRTTITPATPSQREHKVRSLRLTAEEERRMTAEAAQRRFDQIILAGARLADSLDLEATVASAVRVGVPSLVTYCAVDLLEPDGSVRRAAFAHADERPEDLPLDPYAPRGSATVVRTSEPVLFSEPRFGDLLALASSPEHLPLLRDRVRSYLCVPLRAQGRTIGAMTFAGFAGPLAGDDITLANEVARRASLAIDNARLYHAAQDADRRKDEFLALLGHELRNPLAAIVFATARLKRHEAADAVALRVAEVVDRQGARLVRLVDDLVDVSRITRGKIELKKMPMSLGAAVENAVESTRPLVESRQHTLRVRLSAEPITLDADPTRFEQILVNLITNAAKYTNPGGHIEISVARASGEAVVRVCDDGIGIPKESLTTIFAPFSQLNPTLDRTDRGLGVGLALSRSLVELHGGQISAYSAGLGQGAELVVRLPIITRSRPLVPEPQPVTHDVTPVPSTRRRVLVVDDQPDLAALLEEEIASLGHDVRVAHDGFEAVGAAVAFAPELAFIDLGLPGLTGYEVAQRLRKEPNLAKAKLVALTGYGGDETTGKCMEAGFDRHFTKPISEDTLRELLAG